MKEMRRSIRHANISIGVGVLVMVIGVVACKGLGEGALQLVGLAVFFTSLGTYFMLEERARRRRGKGSQ